MPCSPHKERDQSCPGCKDYSPENFRILIVKTGAAGDVIRTTPVIARLKKEYPTAHITWITSYPDLVPRSLVDRILVYSWESTLQLQSESFDLILSLDKNPGEASLVNKIKAQKAKGFFTDPFGKVLPIDQDAFSKWETGINDASMRQNKKHFVEELFEICGFKYQGESYRLDEVKEFDFGFSPARPVIGLNTGSGERWVTRRWPITYFKNLALQLRAKHYNVVVLGGPDEVTQNEWLAKETGATYPGVTSLKDFAGFVKACDLIVTGVTMALHTAIAEKTRVILLNNIFPSNEFFLYGLGEILEPNLSCQACFKPRFDEKCESKNCMSLISVDQVALAIERQLSLPSSTSAETA